MDSPSFQGYHAQLDCKHTYSIMYNCDIKIKHSQFLHNRKTK